MTRRIAVLIAALAAVVAGCSGSSSSGSAGPSTPVSATTPAPGVSSPGGSTTASAHPKPSKSKRPKIPPCTTGQLRLSIGHAEAAAGKFYQRVVLTNTGAAPCTLFGRPGVSFVDAAGNQLGQSAGNDPGREVTVTLPPNGSAFSLLRETDTGVYSKSVCRPATASRLKVYPPNETGALLAPDHLMVCTTSAGRAGVSPVQPGTGE